MPGSILDTFSSGSPELQLNDDNQMPSEVRAPDYYSVPEYREFGNSTATRQLIFDNALRAAQSIQPVSNARHTLALQNVDYDGPESYSIAQQKKAILSRGTLGRKIRGDWVLTDTEGQELARKRATLASVPYLTNRGTMIDNGTEYVMRHQMRLRPGIFSRRKDNGELEAHVNVDRGLGHRVWMDPKNGVFKIHVGQANIALLPLLKSMGVKDAQLKQAWGEEIWSNNMQKADASVMGKLYGKFHKHGTEKDSQAQVAAVLESFAKMGLDPEVTKRTLGQPYNTVDGNTLLAVTDKLLRISRGEDEPDDRDALAFQNMQGPEDLFAERIDKARQVAQQLLWKASAKGSLDHVKVNAYQDAIRSAMLGSGLGQAAEETNPAEIFDHQTSVTRMGEGGITSSQAIPNEARSVQPSQFGFIDFLRTPESGKVGVDLRMASNAVKGRDGRIYTKVRDVRTGQEVYKTPQEMADATMAFPGEMKSPEVMVAAMQNGRVRMVPRKEVNFELPHMESSFSPLGNMIPFKSAVKGQRAVMAARMLTQALPLNNAEAPLVQTGVPGQEGMSYEEKYADKMGAVRSDVDGAVVKVEPGNIVVRDSQGQTHDVPLYENFPYNRKTFLHNTPVVEPGQRVSAGQLLARSNYTDDRGVSALGTNLRVAYVPWGGLNFEDAILVSESAAKDKLASEHMYQHAHEWAGSDKQGLKNFAAIFPGTYDKKMLSRFNADGTVKPGTQIKQGDPLILKARERQLNRKTAVRGSKPSYTDESITWDHHSDGIVTDVVSDGKGVSVVVKSTMPMEVGDKLSGRYGDKGVISKVIPDDEMPTDAEGKPFEVLLNPLGVISRTNPAQIIEAALGKIAAARGEAFRVPDFENEEDLTEFALRELRNAGMNDTDAIIDPRNNRKIPDVFTGNRWFMKLHHTAEGKSQGRGIGSYTAQRTPARGGTDGAKRIGLLETNALLSHGATNILRGSKLVRGQANPQYWSQYMSGFKPPTPEVPFVYTKFVNDLRGAGINVVRQGNRTQIMAMTDKDITELAGDRELQNVETVDWKNMEPVKGGLFDQTLTGGHSTMDGGGNRWSYIKLHEPLPNPVMEEPIIRALGLTKNKYRDILAGKTDLGGKRGPKAIQAALAGLNLNREIEHARAEIASGKKTRRNVAIKRLKYLKSAQDMGMHPQDWVLSKVPVLPPAFRPVSTMGDKKLPLVADPNMLYQELWDSNQNLKDLSELVDEESIGDERLAAYDAFRAVTGLGDPTHPKNQERKVKGILKHVFGNSPKVGTVQRRLLGGTVDLVGRSVITPDPDLNMDEAGIPEGTAWKIYTPAIVSRLVRRGVPRLAAVEAVEDRSAVAREALLKEMDDGVMLINRAPTLHRYGIMAAKPKLVKGDVLKISPLVVGGFGDIFDGDAMSYHALLDDDEKQEAMAKLLPSKNLFSVAGFNDINYGPSQEYVGGIYEASARIDEKNKPLVFDTVADAIKAYRSGRINVDRQIKIMNS